jgi:hypothetical protein
MATNVLNDLAGHRDAAWALLSRCDFRALLQFSRTQRAAYRLVWELLGTTGHRRKACAWLAARRRAMEAELQGVHSTPAFLQHALHNNLEGIRAWCRPYLSAADAALIKKKHDGAAAACIGAAEHIWRDKLNRAEKKALQEKHLAWKEALTKRRWALGLAYLDLQAERRGRELRCRSALEARLGAAFPPACPPFLLAGAWLAGYNRELCLAFECGNGWLRRKLDPKSPEWATEENKADLCEAHGVRLIDVPPEEHPERYVALWLEREGYVRAASAAGRADS